MQRRSPLWLITFWYAAASLVAGLLLPRFEHAYLSTAVSHLSVASAQALLSSVASGMMALTGIVFSIAFVIVQFSSTAYSPRLTALIGQNPRLYHALGFFIATFSYALATLGWVDRNKEGTVPFLSMALVFALLGGSMVSLALLVQQLGTLQITRVLRLVGNEGRRLIERELAPSNAIAQAGDSNDDPAPALADVTQIVTHQGEPLYVVGIDTKELARWAREAEAVISLEYGIGDSVPNGFALLRVHGGRRQLPEPALRQAVALFWSRTLDHDPEYALRLLVDIAIKALSPAINDPTTAVQALDQIEDLLSRMAKGRLETGRVVDAEGRLRVVVPRPTWQDYLSLAFDEIRLCGATSPQVIRRLRAALVAVGSATVRAADAAGVQAYRRHMDESIDASAFDDADRALARGSDRQGLGLTRDGV